MIGLLELTFFTETTKKVEEEEGQPSFPPISSGGILYIMTFFSVYVMNFACCVMKETGGRGRFASFLLSFYFKIMFQRLSF